MLNKFSVEILADSDWDVKKIEESLRLLNFGGGVKVKKIPNRRSPSQNDTFHGWLDVVGNNAHEMGLTIQLIYEEPTEILITPEILKIYAQRIAAANFGEKHTSKLNKEQFSEMVDFLQDKFTATLDNQIPFMYKKYE